MSILALGALGASGCDDDKTDSASDGGGGDTDANGGNGNQNGGSDGGDSGGSDGGEPMVGKQCGDNFCAKPESVLAQCCSGEAMDVCGLQVPGLPPEQGCLPEKAPGKASTGCVGSLNAVLGGMPEDPNLIEIDAAGMKVTFTGCCTDTGICGVDSSMSGLGDLGLGCINAVALAPTMMSGGDAGAGADSGAPATSEPNGLPIIPNVFCNAADGTAATCLPAEVPGMDGTPTKVPPFLLGACAAEVDTTNNCIKNVERNIKGCGTGEEWDRVSLQGLCIDNIADTIYGCDDVSDATLSRIPEFLCGCGEGTTAGPRDVCLSNVDDAVCGTIAVTAKPTCPGGGLLCNLPSILCGCGDGLTALAGAPEGTPCLKNIPLDVCGGTAGCTGLNPQAADSCAGPDNCADVAPFTSTKDAVGDACGCNPSVDIDPGAGETLRDSCDIAQTGQFDCVMVAPGQNRCSCGTVDAQGTCGDGKVCKDTDANQIGDTCQDVPPT